MMKANNSFRSLLIGVGRAFIGWLVSIGLAVLFVRARFAWLPSWLQCTITICFFALAVVALLLALYLTFISPDVGLVRAWRNGNGVRMTLVAVIGLLIVACLIELCRWSRVPEYDSVSPDGQYTIRAYGDNFHFSMTMGGGADRKAKVELVENATGKVLGSGRLPILWMVRDTFWYADNVDVTRGDGGLSFHLPRPMR